jgi:hypothetical protein
VDPFFTAEQGDNIDAGVYPARLVNVEVKEAKADGRPFRLWTFKAKIGADFVDVTTTSSMSNSTSGKAAGWIATLLGHPLAVGESVEIADLTKTTVNLVIVKDINGFSKVEAIAPFKPTEEPKADVTPF